MTDLADRVAQLLAANEPDAARQLIDSVSASEPAGAELGRAALALFRKDAPAAITHGARALELGAGVLAHHYLVMSHLMLGDTATAVEHARAAVALDASPRTRSMLGSVLLSAGRLDDAAAVLRQAVADDPTDAEALTNLASVAFQRADYGEAITSYARAFDLDPTDQRPIQNLVTMFAEIGRWLGAVAALELSRKGEPPPEVADALDLVMVRLVRLIATKYPEPTVDSDADHTVADLMANAMRRAPKTQLVVARTLIDLERHDDARALVHAIEQQPALGAVDRGDLRYLQGLFAERDRDVTRALELYTQALAADAHRVDACVNAVSLLLQDGSSRALEIIGTLIERVPAIERARSAPLLFNEAVYLLRCDRPDEARARLAHLLEVTEGEDPMADLAKQALDELAKR